MTGGTHEKKKFNLSVDCNADGCFQHGLYAASKLSSDNFLSIVDTLVVSFFEIRTRGAGFMPMISEKRKKNPDLNIIMIGGFIGLRPNNCSELVNKYGNLDICNSEKYVTYWGGDEKKWLLRKDFAKEKFLYIDRVALLCGEDKVLANCITRTGNDLLFYDGDHFSGSDANRISTE